MSAFDPAPGVAAKLKLAPRDVAAVLALLADGNTLPFVARYRKEATGGLDEVAIGAIAAEAAAATALEERRAAILATLESQGQLDAALARQIAAATDRATLEDLYLPFKKKRKTRASVARERGLGPLAERLLSQPRDGDPAREARRFLGAEVPDAEAALAGARDIAAEVIAETAAVRGLVRQLSQQHGRMKSEVIAKAVEGKRTAFEDFYDYSEALGRLPAHRVLALFRGEAEGVLRLHLDIDAERLAARIAAAVPLRPTSPWAGELRAAIADGYKRLLGPSIENELRAALRDWAEAEAVEVFASNLQNLLLSAPFGRRAVIGIDPGFRTGCKCAALSDTGRFLDHCTVYPHTTKQGADAALIAFVRRHRPEAIAVGDGTAGRETMAFVRAALAAAGLEVLVVSVGEAGASVYSASEIAREEFPDLDLTIRGAISIGRRLQDPLAELVKVDPRALGVGQYQHDLTPRLLEERLNAGVARCVNRVGVQLDTASAALLTHVAGIGPVAAKRIVEHRDAHGAFQARADLLKVKGIGPKAFEQCAGFLRIRGAKNPLDDSAVHPERYALVARMAADLGVPVARLVGDPTLVQRVEAARYADVGAHTLADILVELARPGLDPRERFEPPRFRDDVREITDLQPGMVLEGVVSNVAAFGAFVDLGVHQDGLIHISELADSFVRDPHAVVSVGQRVTVRVLSVDLERRRIALSRRDVG